jgi:hypothetical protein
MSGLKARTYLRGNSKGRGNNNGNREIRGFWRFAPE